jgi:hypothetical protein
MCKENEHEYIVGSEYEINDSFKGDYANVTKHGIIRTFICKKCGDIKETKAGIEDFKD